MKKKLELEIFGENEKIKHIIEPDSAFKEKWDLIVTL